MQAAPSTEGGGPAVHQDVKVLGASTNLYSTGGSINEQNVVVAIDNTHAAAKTAIHELNEASFPFEPLSIVGRDYHTEEHVVGITTPVTV